MKPVLIILALAFSFYALAQENLDARDPRLNEGSLFTIQFAPADKKITVSLAGKPGAELSAGRVVVFGREITGKGVPRKLEIKPTGSRFEIVDMPPSGRSLEIEVQDLQDKSKKETFRWKVP